jgi:hypothetical protein
MRPSARLVAAAALALPLLLSGCSYLLPSKRRLPVPKAPAIVQTVSPEQLVALLDKRWNDLNALTATVEIYATEYKTMQGEAKTYPSCKGFVVIGKPERLRVLGTYFDVKIFDLASNGTDFTLEIPSKNLAIKGSNTAQGTSKNTWENLRPSFFFNAMVVRGLQPDEHYFVTSDTVTMEDPAKKHLYLVPEYILNINRVKPGSRNEIPVRIIKFHRNDLLPYEQDIYNSKGELQTKVTYAGYRDYNTVLYPSSITIRSPLDGFKLVLDVLSVHENMQLRGDQFKLQLPSGIKIQHIE